MEGFWWVTLESQSPISKSQSQHHGTGARPRTPMRQVVLEWHTSHVRRKGSVEAFDLWVFPIRKLYLLDFLPEFDEPAIPIPKKIREANHSNIDGL